MSKVRTIAAIAALLAVGATRSARADGLADEAELHFQQGAEHYLAKEFKEALEHFLASNRLVPNKNVLFNIARTFEQLGRFADAHRYYVDALEKENAPETVKQLDAAIARIAPNVAVLDIESTPPGATIYVDRRDLGSRGRTPRLLALPPGTYEIIVELPGYELARSGRIDAKLGRAAKVALSLERIVGTVELSGDEGTEVRVGDDHAAVDCKLPCTLPLPPGSHVLYFARAGFQGVSRTVNVTAKQTTSVRVALMPLVGSIVVSTDEREALVEVDGRSAGFTPVVVPNVPAGKRKVRVSLRGYAPIEREVEVLPDQQVELLELRLDPLREVTAASRFTESIEDAPSSVSIISRPELRGFAFPTIAEALRGVRGLSLSNDSIYSSVNVRGIGQPNDYGNRLLVLADGMVMNDDILASSYIGYDGRTDLGDVERIEVVRGAGSVLYGTGAVSGVVNVVTRDRDAPSEVHVAAGTFDGGVARVRAGLHQALGDDTGLWASVALARSDGRTLTLGSVTGLRTSSTTGGLDSFESGTVAGRFWWGPLTMQWLYAKRDLASPLGTYGTVFGAMDTTFVDERGMVELRYEPRLSSLVQLSFRGHANVYGFEGNYRYEDVLNVETLEGVWGGAEARVILTPFDDPRAMRVSIGGTVERHSRAFLGGESVSTSTTGSSASEVYLDENEPYTLAAAYALIEASPADWFRFSVGGRVDHYSTFGTSINPRLSLIFRPTEAGVLKLFGGRAFRAPSIYELRYGDGGFTQIASPDLKPERSWSAEVEYSHRFLDDWVALVALHGTRLEDIIETLGDGTEESPLVYENSSEPVLTGGAEVELRREWRQGWMFAASYGVQGARYEDAPEGSTSARLVNVPQHLASIRGLAPIVPGLANLAARLTVEGPRRVSLDGADETETSVVADVVLSGDVARTGLRYSIGVYNLFDWAYAVPITEGAPTRTLYQNGRTFLLELALSI
ncbi:TonB-dependent receptor [Myxococcota bacterium]|nr:TonB-dependent receptor [Myxococcota bacterium]